jgi:hypothetical protein
MIPLGFSCHAAPLACVAEEVLLLCLAFVFVVVLSRVMLRVRVLQDRFIPSKRGLTIPDRKCQGRDLRMLGPSLRGYVFAWPGNYGNKKGHQTLY